MSAAVAKNAVLDVGERCRRTPARIKSQGHVGQYKKNEELVILLFLGRKVRWPVRYGLLSKPSLQMKYDFIPGSYLMCLELLKDICGSLWIWL